MSKDKFKCDECREATEQILVDEPDKRGLIFCSWDCLMRYAIKKFNQSVPTSANP